LRKEIDKYQYCRRRRRNICQKRGKKVTYNGNAEFAKVPAIKKAREQMWKITQPKRASNKVGKLKLEDLCNRLYLNIH
jgi:hypothetical protein